ncbi:MAG TPA: DUF1684 domain-containing protein [Bryobacteraceae bacterium]|nr:DUF1684 domain-containing protein [Bryobacteraceae bacterium]
MRWRKLIACAAFFELLMAGTSYRAEMAAWRAGHESELKAEDGWLAVAGLFWLKEGTNTAGSDASNYIVLPRGPAQAGVFEFRDGKTSFRASPGVAASVNGKPLTSTAALQDDTNDSPDQVQLAGLTMLVIHRGNRSGIRLKDPESKTRREFTGLRWFPVNESYRVSAKFIAYPKPRMIPITNVLGETEPEASPGYVEFSLNGRPLRLDPVAEDNRLFFIFRDLTAGKETYPAGRFLYADMPKNGVVDLDFNKAENPPCAFTAYATCPLPPKENRLPIRIQAGELDYGHHEPAN